MAVQLVGNKLTDEDVKLLRLEEKKRQLYDRIRNEDLDQEEKQDLYREYKNTKRKIKDIAYTPVGIFDDAQYGHLRKGGSLNLELLQKWRDENMPKMNTETLVEDLQDRLSEKEFMVFVKFYLEDKGYSKIIEEMNISKGYAYDLKSRAKKKIEEKYNLDKAVEILEEADISFEETPEEEETEENDNESEQELSEDENKAIHDAVGEAFESDDPEPEEEQEQDLEPQEETESKKRYLRSFR